MSSDYDQGPTMKDPDESFFGKGIVTHDMSINPSNKMTYMS